MITRPVSWLYVPGDRPDRFAKAAASGAHVVVVDLEDAVAPDHKQRARREAVAWLNDAEPGTVEVRVNARGTPWFAADVEQVTASPGLRAIRLPKVEHPADLDGLDAPVSALLETALGVQNAFAIARHGAVGAVGLGESDLASDLGVDTELGLTWSRSRLVVAARAAGLVAPAMSVYPAIRDLVGLRASCEAGRELGLVGRAAIHPSQIPVVHDAFRPTPEAVRAARVTLDALTTSDGVSVTADGRMVDAAMRRRAEDVLELATTLGA